MIEAALATLVGLFPCVLIVTKSPARFRFLKGRQVRIVRDRFRESHSLGGIYSGLCRAKTRHAFVCGCDMPLLAPELVRALWRARAGRAAVVPRFGGSLQPLCAVYARRCLKPIRRLIRLRQFRVQGIFEKVAVRVVSEQKTRKADKKGLSFLDVDTRRDYREAKRRSRGQRRMYYRMYYKNLCKRK